MTEETPAPEPAPVADVPRRCLVVDATPALQAWVDKAYALAPVVAGPDSDDPLDLPDGTIVLTVATVWRAIEQGFSTEDDAWSIVDMGLPNLDRGVWSNSGPASARNPIYGMLCWLLRMKC